MKKILLITLLLIPILGFSQTTKLVEGFLGIKFGSTKAVVIAAMRAKGAKLDKESDADMLEFDNASLGHRETDVLGVKFVNNKAFEADFYFKSGDQSNIIEYYDSLVTDITDIYGKGDTVRKFTPPYYEGDGHEIGALLVGAAKMNTMWMAANKNIIEASIEKIDDTTLDVELIYQDGVLVDEAIAKQKAKEKGDF
jgi:hypothetical protein